MGVRLTDSPHRLIAPPFPSDPVRFPEDRTLRLAATSSPAVPMIGFRSLHRRFPGDHPQRRDQLVVVICLLLWGVWACGTEGKIARAGTPPHAQQAEGAALFKTHCAKCHGNAGEGTKDYPIALTGDKSLLELAKVIDETMPEGEPELVSRPQAEALAAYIHDAFYSPLAQARNKPATVEFSRLTVRQFENCVTDLLLSFRGRESTSTEQGLKGEYYNLRSFNKDKRVIERVDPAIDFSFGEQKPEGFPTEPDMEKRRKDDIHDHQEFSIRWQGHLLAPETGDYEFIVESENGFRLFVNDTQHALCDAWVSSGNENALRGRIHLLGGRRYPIRLEMFRYKQPTASIRLKWKRPGRVDELISSRFLRTGWTPSLFVLNTPFPPDDRSVGYERASSISKRWQDAVVQASLETADSVVDDFQALAKISDKETPDEQARKRQEFCEKFVERAFRRPLTAPQKEQFITSLLDGAPPETGIRRVVLLTLMSPEFLYREHGRKQFDSMAIASWLSFTLWDSLPDQPLLEAAGKNELHTREQLSRQVDRMLKDPRTHEKLSRFFQQWLRLDQIPEIVKDQQMYPGFDRQIVSSLRESLDLFLDELLSSPTADFRRLFLEETLYLNGNLSSFYGASLAAGASFEKVSFDAEDRSGILTHPLLLSGFAYDQESSPIHRGVFIARSLLGRRLKPPPEAVAPLAPDLHADLTTRARVLLQTSPDACRTCHYMINDLGFSLEHFDAVGRYREQDKLQPVDAHGSYLNRAGKEVSFANSRELAEFLVSAPEVHEAFTEQLFQYTVRQPVRAFGVEELPRLTNWFTKHDFNMRELLKEIAIGTALRMQEMDQPVRADQDRSTEKVGNEK